MCKKCNLLFPIALFLFLGILSHASSCFAVPGISSVSGTVANGQTITIKGSSFGTTGPIVVLSDSFEKGTNGTNISVTSGSADVNNWTLNDGKGRTYSTDYAHGGSKSMKIDWSVGSIGGPQLNYSSVQNSSIFISWWQYLPTDRQVPGTNHVDGPNWKWYWLGDGTDDWPWGSDYTQVLLDNNNGAFAALQGGGDDTGTPTRWSGSWFTPRFTKGRWDRISVSAKNATSGGYFWYQEVDSTGQTIQFNGINVVTAHSGDPWNVLTLPGFGRQDNDAVAYYDDVYVAIGTAARARVEIGDKATYANCTNLAIITPTAWSDTSITATVRSGSFTSGQSAYLYVVDANGVTNANGYPVVIGGGSVTADNPPAISITSPTSQSTYVTTENVLNFAGSASDDFGISNVTWSNNRGGSGTATNVSGNWSSWSIANLSLQDGQNVITVTCTDSANQKTMTTLTVSYSSTPSTTPVLAWSANQQTGDGTWKNSGVTYCVRLLVQGNNITASANKVQLGFQGRSSGAYTIRKVSIAERDDNSSLGNVIDSTWTMVTFDGRSSSSWGTDTVTVAEGIEKKSDPIPFSLVPGKDYYITFKIDTPSVYLNPPSGYSELYFDSADHASDVDWAGNGFGTTQDFHAAAAIYAVPQNGTVAVPTGLTIKQ